MVCSVYVNKLQKQHWNTEFHVQMKIKCFVRLCYLQHKCGQQKPTALQTEQQW